MLELKHCNEPEGLKAFRDSLHGRIDKDSWAAFQRQCPAAHNELLQALYEEQNGLCAYCEMRIVVGRHRVDHIHPRSVCGNETLNYDNLALSCDGDFSCDKAKKNKIIPVEPRRGCAEKIRMVNWKLKPSLNLSTSEQQAVTNTISFLGLNCERLRGERYRHYSKYVKKVFAKLCATYQDKVVVFEKILKYCSDGPFRNHYLQMFKVEGVEAGVCRLHREEECTAKMDKD